MYNNNFYIFISLLIFSVLLFIFNSFIGHHFLVDIATGLAALSALTGFVYLIKFPDAEMQAFYLLYCAMLIVYVLVFAGTRIYALFNHMA